MDQTTLLVNLGVALGAGLVGAYIANRLGQSVILGYILGGVAIGPYTPGVVGDRESVEALANIGIILLMFALGMRLSVRQLLRVGRVAVLGGALQVLVTIGIGYLIGRALGWDWLPALFFGAVVSNSSSTVLGKVLDERGEAGSIQGRIGLAWSTIQDLSTIILVVILSTLSTGGNSLASDLFWPTLKAAAFLVVLIPVGSRVLPWIFERIIAPARNREIFVIAVAAFALGTAYLSSLFGLSLAIGAFVAGVVVSESDIWHQILGEIMPLRDIFAGLFFVSIGILVDPMFVLRNLPLVLVVLVTIVVIKGLLVTGITLLFGYSLRTAMLTGVTLAQSAEFSFLLAGVGIDLGAITSAIFSLFLAGTTLSIVLAPALHELAPPAIDWIEKRLPEPKPAHHPVLGAPAIPLRGHAVICGYGRVGQVVGEALGRRRFLFVVIDHDQEIVQRLRKGGITALMGAADNPVLLDRAQLGGARILVVAIPDALASRRIVDYALQYNPNLEIAVRTQSLTERTFLQTRGVTEAVMGELELALEITRFALCRFGVSALETQALVQRLRLELAPDGEQPSAATEHLR